MANQTEGNNTLCNSQVDLDHLMSPSKYAFKYPSDVAVDYHVQNVTKQTDEARKLLKCDLGVPCSSDGPTIDLYYPADMSAAKSVMIFIHGGYWQALSTDQCGGAAIAMTDNNMIYTAINYDIAPKANMTTIIKQCRVACAYIAKKFPDKRLYIGGNSAGGHLTAMMLMTNWSEYGLNTYPFKGAVLINGVYDLVPIQKCYVNDLLQLTDEEVAHFSPLSLECSRNLSQLTSNGVWCILAEGEYEPPPFKEQRKKYIELLKSHKIDCTFIEEPNEDHFTITERFGEPDFNLTKVALEFINKRTT